MSEHLAHLPTPGDAIVERSNNWQEAFWAPQRSATATLPGRRQMVWTEQGELFSGEAAAPAPQVFKEPVIAKPIERTATVTRPRTRAKTAAVAVPAPVAHRTPSRAYAEQRKSVRTADIARYLQVNGAVDGVKAATRFGMPQRDSSTFDRALWKGRAVGTPFVKGC